ncbi:MAG TPA: YbaY family lipoprotein [Tahibacter sp.]|uniref:YbaY family lipoprotein n=1 Tax=Tahibacter sp. TaxID=2056211 RepID=UPI002C4D87CC|nr:YbaY family lipoprotein [Tahibacter sp.]HSX62132.1 YbaY family lipoprotein [Tahibacter sp.]
MQKLALPLLFASLVLAACGPSNDAGNQPRTSAQAPMPTSVTGTVSLKVPAPIGPSAQLKLALTNVSMKPEVTVAQSTTQPGQLPAQFQLPFEPGKIDQNALYVLNVELIDGERRYVAPRQYPVLTRGSSSKADVVMTPEPTASEKLDAEYASLERAIGGMKRSQGSSEDEASTTAWDGFFDKSGLRYIREIVDFGDKGRTNTYYAYREGKPMAVVVERVPAMAERPNAVTRAGWDANALLVVKTKKEGGTVGVLADADAKALYDRAVAKYDVISKRTPK